MIREFKKAVNTKLNEALKGTNAKIFFDTADAAAPFPHVVFDYTSLPYKEGLYQGDLDIDIYDRSPDFRRVDEIADTVGRELDKWSYLNDKVYFTLYLRTITDPEEDEDPTLKRKIIIFEIQMRRV